MDKLLVNAKIDSVIRCIQRVEDKTADNFETFEADIDAQDIVVLNLSRAVQLCVDIAMHMISSSKLPVPQTMAASFEKLCAINVISEDLANKMIKSVGFRNVAIHSYDDIDLAIVYSIAHDHLQDFKKFVREIVDYVDSPQVSG